MHLCIMIRIYLYFFGEGVFELLLFFIVLLEVVDSMLYATANELKFMMQPEFYVL